MTMEATGVSVRREVTVDAAPERAFDVFNAGFDRWWPRTHKLGEADLAEAILEPRLGGRWYERCVDGSECDWGQVLAYEPPRRLLLSWLLDPAFELDPDNPTEVEVTFTELAEGRTRVEVEHRGLERFGPEGAERMRAAIGSGEGWGGILRRYAEAVRA
jgi:uncharacterized protein YndB with AHSA1/START domain